MIMEHWWNDTGSGNAEIFEEGLVPAPLVPPQILHGQNFNRTCGETETINKLIYGAASLS
jgi:hypothetical protein